MCNLVHQPLIGDNSTVPTVESESESLYQLLGLRNSPCVFCPRSDLGGLVICRPLGPVRRLNQPIISSSFRLFFLFSSFSILPSFLLLSAFILSLPVREKGRISFSFIYLFFYSFFVFQKRKKSIEINNPAHPKVL